MTVTKSVTTVTATWTASQFFNGLRQALIDAGWMTDWHDSYTASGVEYGIMKVDYDNTKTYGTAYYMFSVSTSSVYVYIFGGWNSASNQPSGVQYFDYFSLTPSNNASTVARITTSTNQTYSLSAYRSGVDPNFAILSILPDSSSSVNLLFLVTPGMAKPGWLDLNKTHLNGLTYFSFSASNFVSRLEIKNFARLRRSALYGQSIFGWTSENDYSRAEITLCNFSTCSAVSGGSVSNYALVVGILVPSFDATANSGYASDYQPIMTGFPSFAGTTDVFPSDIGLWAPFATRSYSTGDILQVSAGTNEWEVIRGINQTGADRTSLFLVGRIA